MRIRNFEVLYSRAALILREITNYWSGSIVLRNLRGGWKSMQNDHWLSTFREHIHVSVTTVTANVSVSR